MKNELNSMEVCKMLKIATIQFLHKLVADGVIIAHPSKDYKKMVYNKYDIINFKNER